VNWVTAQRTASEIIEGENLAVPGSQATPHLSSPNIKRDSVERSLENSKSSIQNLNPPFPPHSKSKIQNLKSKI
jgi:hypothetical protein